MVYAQLRAPVRVARLLNVSPTCIYPPRTFLIVLQKIRTVELDGKVIKLQIVRPSLIAASTNTPADHHRVAKDLPAHNRLHCAGSR